MKRFISLMAILLTMAGTSFSQPGRNTSESDINKLALAITAIDMLYVDTVNTTELVNSAIEAMSVKLDPHSRFISAQEVKKEQENLTGNFSGIGVQFNVIDDTVFVQQPIVDGPSEKAGVLSGDRIVMAIIGADTINLTGENSKTSFVQQNLRGEKGTVVTLGIVRRGYDDYLFFKVVRGDIPVNSIDAAYLLSKNTGYIHISNFSATTSAELDVVLTKMKEDGVNQIVLDLCDNGGGLMGAAIEVAGKFMKKDQLIVYTQGRAYGRDDYVSEENGVFSDGKLVVLINENSASASEIVTGALQDWDRATVIGRRSFGKGLVQRPIPFRDGSELRLTIARYYTPSGRCIQKPYGEDIDYNADITNRLSNGELLHVDSIHFADSLKYKTLVNGKTVYGGGGIMPDVFVPMDTTKTTQFYRDITAKGIVLSAVTGYVESNKTKLQKQYSTFPKFNSKFDVEKSGLVDLIIDRAGKEGIEVPSKDSVLNEMPYLMLQLKGYVARSMFTLDEFYYIVNKIDPIYQAALKEMNVKL